jgi:dipeptidyl aminopeptidase/acylaminoacyl peptidase
MPCSTRESVLTSAGPGRLPSPPDRPERIAVTAAGDSAAFVVSSDPTEPSDAAGLWFGPLNGRPAKIADLVPDTNLAFAPDGRTFAAAVQDEEGSRLIVVDPAARETSWRQLRLPGFAERLAWTADGLLALAAGPGADAASLTSGKPLGPPADDPAVAGTRGGQRRLWRIDAASGTPVAASPAELSVWEFAPIPGGGAVVVGSEDPTEAGWYHSRLAVVDADGRITRLLRESPWQLSAPAVRPDGGVVAYVEGWASDRGLLAGEVHLVGLHDGAGQPARTLGPLDIGIDVTWLSWAADGRLWMAGWHHLGTAWGWAEGLAGAEPAAGEVTVQVEQASCLNSRWHPEVVPLPDGSALTMRSTSAQPPEVVRMCRGSEPEPWTALNARSAAARRMRVRELRWKGSDGTQIEGLLAEPSPTGGTEVGGACEPRPLVVDIHGGPSLAWHHSWDLPWAELLTAAGYAVLMPNPRGSAGRGQAFARANLSDPAGAEFDDIAGGVAHCVGEGIAEPGQAAVMGASYGGYLSAWAIAEGSAFRCGVVIAGMSDLVSCRGTANNAPFYDYLLGGRPSEIPVRYLERSPVARLSASSLPTLILHGREDRCVPVGQAEELYSALRELGVPVELVVYPREGHQVRERDHVLDQRERILRWLAAHLENSS